MQMETQDAAAVARVLDGDPDAFRVLVEQHSRRVFLLAYRMMGNEQDAEEIVQETFLRAYRALGRFEARSSVATWLFRIAANCANDALASRKIRPQPAPVAEDEDGPEMQLVSEAPTPERAAYSTELKARIASAMDKLTAVERTAFVLRHMEGVSINDIAATLRVRPASAKQSVFRAVRKLRQELAFAARLLP